MSIKHRKAAKLNAHRPVLREEIIRRLDKIAKQQGEYQPPKLKQPEAEQVTLNKDGTPRKQRVGAYNSNPVYELFQSGALQVPVLDIRLMEEAEEEDHTFAYMRYNELKSLLKGIINNFKAEKSTDEWKPFVAYATVIYLYRTMPEGFTYRTIKDKLGCADRTARNYNQVIGSANIHIQRWLDNNWDQVEEYTKKYASPEKEGEIIDAFPMNWGHWGLCWGQQPSGLNSGTYEM